MGEELGERPAEDDIVWVVMTDDVGEARGEAGGDIGVSLTAAHRGGESLVGGTDGFGRGDVFPL